MNAMISLPDMLIVAGFLAATLVIGLRLRNGQHKGSSYILGGRALTLPAFIATTVSTWYGGILGVGEYSWSYGISNWLVFGVPYYVGALLFALFLSHRARASESLTIPHRFEKHYGHAAAYTSGILIFLTTIPGAYMLIMGTLCSLSFGISQTISIILAAVFVVAYLWHGGFKAVVKTDAIQCALMFGSFIALTGWLLFGYGLEPLSTLPQTHLEPTGGQPLGSILIWYVIALSTLAEPNFFQRAFAAKTPKIARKGLLLSIVCWIVFDLMTTICGLYARALLPNLENPMHAFPALAAHVLPIGIVGLFFAGMIATVLSTLDSNLFTCATTFGRDLWHNKENEDGLDIRRIRIGLILSAAIAVTIAISAGSIIKIWKIFGSVSAASLLIPILGTYYRPLKMSETGALVLMIASALTTIAWFICGRITGSQLLGLEPLFAGGIVSIFCWIGDFALRNISSRTQNALK